MPDPIDWGFALPYFAAAFAGGYLLGSIPTGLLLTRLAGLGDIRKIGSGNIGATNALRTGRRWIGVGTLAGDAGKAALAVYLGNQYGTRHGDPRGGGRIFWTFISDLAGFSRRQRGFCFFRRAGGSLLASGFIIHRDLAGSGGFVSIFVASVSGGLNRDALRGSADF